MNSRKIRVLIVLAAELCPPHFSGQVMEFEKILTRIELKFNLLEFYSILLGMHFRLSEDALLYKMHLKSIAVSGL